MRGSRAGCSAIQGARRSRLGWAVDLTTWGTFARALAAWYQTGAPTDGSTGFMAQAASGARVLENKGDGAGACLRIEGARTNLITFSRDVTGVAWNAPGGGATATKPGTKPSPDGTLVADLMTSPSASFNRYFTIAGTTVGVRYAMSLWSRRDVGAGSGAYQAAHQDGTPSGSVETGTLTETYRRIQIVRAASNVTSYHVPHESRALAWSSALAQTGLVDMHNYEAGAFPSSFISTAGGTVTRPADTLTGLSGDVPADLFTTPGQFLEVSPEFASSDLVSGDVFWLLSIGGGNNGIRIRHNGADVRAEVLEAGAVRAQSLPLAFQRDELLGPLAWNPADGTIYAQGFSGTPGTPWTWAPDGVRVGGILSGTSEAFCRFGALTSA